MILLFSFLAISDVPCPAFNEQIGDLDELCIGPSYATYASDDYKRYKVYGSPPGIGSCPPEESNNQSCFCDYNYDIAIDFPNVYCSGANITNTTDIRWAAIIDDVNNNYSVGSQYICSDIDYPRCVNLNPYDKTLGKCYKSPAVLDLPPEQVTVGSQPDAYFMKGTERANGDCNCYNRKIDWTVVTTDYGLLDNNLWATRRNQELPLNSSSPGSIALAGYSWIGVSPNEFEQEYVNDVALYSPVNLMIPRGSPVNVTVTETKGTIVEDPVLNRSVPCGVIEPRPFGSVTLNTLCKATTPDIKDVVKSFGILEAGKALCSLTKEPTPRYYLGSFPSGSGDALLDVINNLDAPVTLAYGLLTVALIKYFETNDWPEGPPSFHGSKNFPGVQPADNHIGTITNKSINIFEQGMYSFGTSVIDYGQMVNQMADIKPEEYSVVGSDTKYVLQGDWSLVSNNTKSDIGRTSPVNFSFFSGSESRFISQLPPFMGKTTLIGAKSSTLNCVDDNILRQCLDQHIGPDKPVPTACSYFANPFSVERLCDGARLADTSLRDMFADTSKWVKSTDTIQWDAPLGILVQNGTNLNKIMAGSNVPTALGGVICMIEKNMLLTATNFGNLNNAIKNCSGNPYCRVVQSNQNGTFTLFQTCNQREFTANSGDGIYYMKSNFDIQPLPPAMTCQEEPSFGVYASTSSAFGTNGTIFTADGSTFIGNEDNLTIDNCRKACHSLATCMAWRHISISGWKKYGDNTTYASNQCLLYESCTYAIIVPEPYFYSPEGFEPVQSQNCTNCTSNVVVNSEVLIELTPLWDLAPFSPNAVSDDEPNVGSYVNNHHDPLNTNCAADYGSTSPCCGQGGTAVQPAYQCPEAHPICTNYRLNQHWGNCVNNETSHFTTFPLSVWLSDVGSQYFNYLELADPLLFQTGVLAEAFANLQNEYNCEFPEDDNVYGVLHDNNDFVISKTDDSLDNLCQTIEFPGTGLSGLPTKLASKETIPFDDYNDDAREAYDGPLFVVSFGSINGTIMGVETEMLLSYAVAAAITMEFNDTWISDKIIRPDYDLGKAWWHGNNIRNFSDTNVATALLSKTFTSNVQQASVNAHTEGYTYPYGCGVFQFIGGSLLSSNLAGGVGAFVECLNNMSKCYQLYLTTTNNISCNPTFTDIVNQNIDRECGLNPSPNVTSVTYAQMGPKSFLFGVPPEPISLKNASIFSALPDYKDLYIHHDVRVICHDVWAPSFWYNNIGKPDTTSVNSFNGAPLAQCNITVLPNMGGYTSYVPLSIPTAPFKKILPFIVWVTRIADSNDPFASINPDWPCTLIGGIKIEYQLDNVIETKYFSGEEILKTFSTTIKYNGVPVQCSGYLNVNIFYDEGTTPNFLCGVSNSSNPNYCLEDSSYYGQIPFFTASPLQYPPAVFSEFVVVQPSTGGFDCTTLPAETICGMADPSNIPGNGTNLAGFAQNISNIIPSLRHIPDLEYGTSKTNTEHLFGGARRTRTDQTGISELCTPANLGGGTTLSDGGSGGFTYRQRYFVNFPFPCTYNDSDPCSSYTDRSAFTLDTAVNNVLLRGPNGVFVESPGTITFGKVYKVPTYCQDCTGGSKITGSYGKSTNIYLPSNFPDSEAYNVKTLGPGRTVLEGQKDGMYFFVPTNVNIGRMLGKLGELVRTEKQKFINPFEDWGYSVDQLTRGCQTVTTNSECADRRECILVNNKCQLRTEGPNCFGATESNCSHPVYPVCVWVNITGSETSIRLGGGFAVVNATNKFSEACVPITWKRPLNKATLAGMVEEGTITPAPGDNNNTDILGAISACGNNPKCIVSEPWFVYGRAFLDGFSTNYTGDPYWDTFGGRLRASDVQSNNTIAKGGTPVYNMSCDGESDTDSCSILVDFITDLECPKNPAGQWSGSCIKPSLQLALPNQTKQAYIGGTYLFNYLIPEEKECPVGDGIRDSEVWLEGIQMYSGYSADYKFLEDMNFCQSMGTAKSTPGSLLPFCINNGLTPSGRQGVCNEQSATLQATGYVLPALTDQHKLCIRYNENSQDKAHCFYLPGSITRLQTLIDDYANADLTIDIMPFSADFFASLLFCPEVEDTMYTNQVAPGINSNFTNISPEQMPFVANQSIYNNSFCIAELFTSYVASNITEIRQKLNNLALHFDGNPVVNVNDYQIDNPMIWALPGVVQDVKITERRFPVTIRSAVETYPVTWYQDDTCLLLSISDSDHVTISNINIHLKDSCLGQGFYSVPIRLSGVGVKYATIDIGVNLDTVTNPEVVPTALGIVGSLLFSAALRKSIIDISGLRANITTTDTNMVGAIIVNAESTGNQDTPVITTNAKEIIILQSDNITTNTLLVDLADYLKPFIQETKTPPSLDILIIIVIVILSIFLISLLFVFFDIIQ